MTKHGCALARPEPPDGPQFQQAADDQRLRKQARIEPAVNRSAPHGPMLTTPLLAGTFLALSISLT